MSNTKWDKYFIDVANRTAELSHAKKLQVGAVAVRDKRIILCGFNGTPPGDDNNCEDIIDGNLITKSSVLHAEENLIVFSAKLGISLKNSHIYITHNPCSICSRLIYGAGIKRVVYKNFYKDDLGIQFLKSRNILIEQFLGDFNDSFC